MKQRHTVTDGRKCIEGIFFFFYKILITNKVCVLPASLTIDTSKTYQSSGKSIIINYNGSRTTKEK